MKYIWIIMLTLADVAWWIAAVKDIKNTLSLNKKISDYNVSLQAIWDMWHGEQDISWVDFEFYTLTCVGTHLAVLFIISFVKWASQYVTIGL